MFELDERHRLSGGESWNCAVQGISETLAEQIRGGLIIPAPRPTIEYVAVTHLGRICRGGSPDELSVPGFILGGLAVNGHETKFDFFVSDSVQDGIYGLTADQMQTLREMAHE
jgi:hypothetical protein